MEIIILACFAWGLIAGWNGSTDKSTSRNDDSDDDSAGDPLYHHMHDQIDF
jgi:hypothetical protein